MTCQSVSFYNRQARASAFVVPSGSGFFDGISSLTLGAMMHLQPPRHGRRMIAILGQIRLGRAVRPA